MKKLISLVAVALIGGLIAYVLIPKNQPAPAFSLQDLNGQTVDNASLNGKVTFINFWFPSCPGCVSEMPKVIKMSNDYQGKPFQVLGIAVPVDPIESVRAYTETRQMKFPVMFDTVNVVSKAFNTTVYPTSVLINKKGEVLKTFVGEPDFQALYQTIDSEIAKD